jgi:hypothetical protein
MPQRKEKAKKDFTTHRKDGYYPQDRAFASRRSRHWSLVMSLSWCSSLKGEWPASMPQLSELMSRAAAIHAFVLPTDFSISPQITTLALSHPILDFTILQSSQLLISSDPAFGVFTHNQTGLPPVKGKAAEATVSSDQASEMSNSMALVQVGAGASVSYFG